jgi:excisionase family DNA binding protein
MTNDAVLLTIKELAAQLQIPVQSIYRWRYAGVGPKGIRIGRHVRFRQRDVDAWLDEQAAKGTRAS